MYEYEYFSRETLDQATKSTLERLRREIDRAQRRIEYLKSEDFKKVKRRYKRWTSVYIRLAKSGKYNQKRLDHLDDRIDNLLEIIRDYLAEDGWYIGQPNSVELPEVDHV